MASMKTYKKNLKISALILLICVIAFVLVYYFLINPQDANLKNIDKQIVQNEDEYKLAQIASKADTQERISGEISTLQNKLDEFVLNYKSSADLTFDISQIANECGLSSFNVKSKDLQIIADSTDPNNIFEKHIKVSFVAGFHEFAVFLNSLERHKPVLFVNEFMLNSQNKDSGTYLVTLDLAALVQKQQVAEVDDGSTSQFNDVKL